MKRSPLNKVSKDPRRRAARFVPASVIAEVKARSGGLCEVIIEGQQCEWKAMNQPHHILKRSRGGKHTLDNLLDVCFMHHRYIEDNETWAVKHGYSLPYEGYKI